MIPGRGGQAVLVKRTGIRPQQISLWWKGPRRPDVEEAATISQALGVDLLWLATGEGTMNAAAAGFTGVPIYDVRLAAGTASFAEGARTLGEMPFDIDLLRQLGRTNADDLGVLEADGDSMEPTIADGARVVIDFRDTRLREGVFAFRLGDELRIKRLRRMVDGVEILSDNARYQAEALVGVQLEDFAVIGRALWSGSVL